MPALGRWRQEGAQPGPDAGDVGPGEGRGGDGVGGIEQVVDILGGTGRIVQRAGVVRVGGPDIHEVRVRPGQDENGPLVLADGGETWAALAGGVAWGSWPSSRARTWSAQTPVALTTIRARIGNSEVSS